MPAEAVAPELAEDLGERPHAELARGSRCELQPAAVALQVAGLLERAGQLAQLLEIPGGVVARQVAQQIVVDAIQGVGVARAGERLLHLVEALLPVDGGHRLRQAHRLVAREGIRLAEALVGPQRLEIACQARHVPAQPVVAQQVVHHLLQLGAHLRAHAVEHRCHLARLSTHVVDELVDVLDTRREIPAMLGHELAEVLWRVGRGGVLLEQLVEVLDHFAHAGQILRRHALDALLQSLEIGLQHLLAQLVG